MSATLCIQRALGNPYDDKIPDTRDVSRVAALAVIEELTGRGGIGNELESYDNEIREDIIDSLSDIIATVIAMRG